MFADPSLETPPTDIVKERTPQFPWYTAMATVLRGRYVYANVEPPTWANLVWWAGLTADDGGLLDTWEDLESAYNFCNGLWDKHEICIESSTKAMKSVVQILIMCLIGWYSTTFVAVIRDTNLNKKNLQARQAKKQQ